MAEAEQYRIKVQRFTSGMDAEVTLQRVSFDRDIRAYQRAYDQGWSSVLKPARGRRDPDKVADAESLELTARRAKRAVRVRVKELAPSALVTFTTRRVYALDALLDVWARFNRLARLAGFTSFEYVAVPEPHPSNPDHLHIHAACRGAPPISVLRRLWHIALEGHEGRRVVATLRGSDSPGNIDVQSIKARDLQRRVAKIAKYVAKYISKDLIDLFGRRRYWHSRGFCPESSRVYWLDSLDYAGALLEAVRVLGGSEDDLPALRPFMPSDRVAWWTQNTEGIP